MDIIHFFVWLCVLYFIFFFCFIFYALADNRIYYSISQLFFYTLLLSNISTAFYYTVCCHFILSILVIFHFVDINSLLFIYWLFIDYISLTILNFQFAFLWFISNLFNQIWLFTLINYYLIYCRYFFTACIFLYYAIFLCNLCIFSCITFFFYADFFLLFY